MTVTNPTDLIALSALMGRTSGVERVVVGVIDGPVDLANEAFAGSKFVDLGGKLSTSGVRGAAIAHGTFVTGMLAAARGGSAPAICPGCTFAIRPIYTPDPAPAAGLDDLAAAIIDCIEADARVINISSAIESPGWIAHPGLSAAISRATGRGCVLVSATGNASAIRGTSITMHPGVIPVVSYGPDGYPSRVSNIGRSIGLYGLGAPGENIASVGLAGSPSVSSGTSVAAPFVSGAFALLMSVFPKISTREIHSALLNTSSRRTSVVPPLMNVEAAFTTLRKGMT